MDYEKLIAQYQNAADHWRKNKPDFPDVASSYERAATALATIQAENERLKNKLSELAHLPFDEPGIGERTRLLAENESLRAEVEHWKNAHHQAALNFQQENRECNKVLAELEQVKRCIEIVENQRDSAIKELENYMVQDVLDGNEPCAICAKASDTPCEYCNPKWRGQKED